MYLLALSVYLVAVSQHQVGAVKLSGLKPDCQGVEPISLAAMQAPEQADACQMVNRLDLVGPAKALERHHLIQSCTCNLIQRDLVWRSLLAPHVQLLASTVRSIVEPRESGCDEPTFLELLKDLLADQEGRGWMRNELISRIERQEAGERPGRELLADLGRGCRNYVSQFGPYMSFFRGMARVSNNERYVHSITAYDANLFQDMIGYYACELFLADF